MAARHAFKGASILAVLVCRLDARHKHRHSANRASTVANRRRGRRIKTVLLRHSALPLLYRRERDWSLSHRRLAVSQVGDRGRVRPTWTRVQWSFGQLGHHGLPDGLRRGRRDGENGGPR
jgi:hypothetical protein